MRAMKRTSSAATITTREYLRGRRRDPRRIARRAGVGSRLRRGRRDARADDRAGLSAGREGLPGIPAPGYAGGVRARAHRAQDGGGLSALPVLLRALRDA